MSDDATAPVSVVLVGLGGYGEVYLGSLLDEPRGAGCHIVGGVDPRPDGCRRLADLEARKVPVHGTLEDFYRERRADLAVISSPIQLHADHTCAALAAGSHVLLEKPAAGSTADVDRMIAARDRAGRFVAVGFQWSFAESVLALKADILRGRLGRPLRGKALTLWPRTEAYYGRNDWAGRRRDSAGRWILDSPANNAMAHHLHNLLFLLGGAMDRSAEPLVMDARLSRANDIETFDTAAVRLATDAGAEVLFLASHAIAEGEATDPRFTLELEEGTVTYPGGTEPVTARHRDGTVWTYPHPDASAQVRKLWESAEAVRRWPDVGRGGDGSVAFPPCGLETARPHVTVVEALERSGVAPFAYGEESVRITETPGGRLHWVDGLADAMREAYEAGEMPTLPACRSM
jgi:predicted dehydrogenase